MLLADFVQAAEGKLNAIGAGWNITGPMPTPSGVGIIFEVPWDRANDQIHFRLELLDQDEQPFMMETPDGAQPLLLEGAFEVGRPPGTKRGTSLNFPIAANIGPQPLQPGGRYVWRLTVDGDTNDDWRLPFSVRTAAQGFPGMPGLPG
jgi:hypothetical protein